MKSHIKNILFNLARKLIWTRAGQECPFNLNEIRSARLSFSQMGEDLRINDYLKYLSPSDGIYISVGAFDPVRFSNTFLLHKRGFRGINIDID
jgi:hypothetical protein